MGGILLLVFGGLIVWNSGVKLRVIGLLAQRAVECGTVRGYWSDYFEHCLDGQYSRLFALAIAVPVFVVLLAVVPLVARRRERCCRAAFELLLQELRAGKPPAVATQSARAFLTDRRMAPERAAGLVDAFVDHLTAASRSAETPSGI